MLPHQPTNQPFNLASRRLSPARNIELPSSKGGEGNKRHKPTKGPRAPITCGGTAIYCTAQYFISWVDIWSEIEGKFGPGTVAVAVSVYPSCTHISFLIRFVSRGSLSGRGMRMERDGYVYMRVHGNFVS